MNEEFDDLMDTIESLCRNGEKTHAMMLVADHYDLDKFWEVFNELDIFSQKQGYLTEGQLKERTSWLSEMTDVLPPADRDLIVAILML